MKCQRRSTSKTTSTGVTQCEERCDNQRHSNHHGTRAHQQGHTTLHCLHSSRIQQFSLHSCPGQGDTIGVTTRSLCAIQARCEHTRTVLQVRMHLQNMSMSRNGADTMALRSLFTQTIIWILTCSGVDAMRESVQNYDSLMGSTCTCGE